LKGAGGDQETAKITAVANFPPRRHALPRKFFDVEHVGAQCRNPATDDCRNPFDGIAMSETVRMPTFNDYMPSVPSASRQLVRDDRVAENFYASLNSRALESHYTSPTGRTRWHSLHPTQ